MGHPQIDLLSALADGELDLSTLREIEPHLASCERCRAQVAEFRGLDTTLSSPAPLTCLASRDLRSALADGELSAGEATVARAHVATCPDCQTEQVAWRAAERLLVSLPAAMPSAALDARIARLTAPRRERRLARTAGGLALRGAVAAAVVMAILVGLLPGAPAGPDVAVEAPAPEGALVAGVQLVLFSRTNTLYVLQSQLAAVDALDASTYALRTRIAVGGRPSALALNEAASRVLVLDASAKSLTEIDAERNAVVSTTSVPVNGTPTAINVDQTTGKIYVSSIADVPGAGGGPSPTPQGAGQVTVLDGTTKKLEVVRSFEVAPRVVVPDPDGKGSLLVSPNGSTLVDKAYQPVRTLPGGVSAAFGSAGRIAVLGADSGGSLLTLVTDGSPVSLRLAGAPLAVTSLPDGGFAVLLGSGNGNGQIFVIDASGHVSGEAAVTGTGRDLAYDALSKRFLVVSGGGKVSSIPLPTSIVAGASPSPATSPATAQPSAPPATASPNASAAPEASSAPLGPPPPVVAQAPSVPRGAELVWPDVYRIPLADHRVAVLTAAAGEKQWFLDQHNGLSSLDMVSGEVFSFSPLPRDAEISTIAAGSGQVYAVDAKKGRLFVLSLASERVTTLSLSILRSSTAAALAPDGTLWITTDTASLVSYEPVTGRTRAVPIAASAQMVAPDNAGRIWFGGASVLGYYDPIEGRVVHFPQPGSGAATVLLPDLFGTLWVGTTTGEIFAVRNGEAGLVLKLARPITTLAVGPAGRVWYAAPAPIGVPGFVYGPVASPAAQRTLPFAVTSLALNPRGRAWLADPAGAFYLVVGE